MKKVIKIEHTWEEDRRYENENKSRSFSKARWWDARFDNLIETIGHYNECESLKMFFLTGGEISPMLDIREFQGL